MVHKSKLMLPVLAVIVGAAASAFTVLPKAYKAKNANSADMYYFQFVGTRNQDEGLRTQWDLLPSQSAYELINCPQGNYGCKLEATAIVMINGEAHPKEVYTSPNTNVPTTGTYVAEVKNTLSE